MGSYTGNDSNNYKAAETEWDFWPYPRKVWNSWTMTGKGGDDQLIGGPKNDTLYGDYAFGSPSGISGNDYLSGGDGNDKIYGEDGNDNLIGGNGNDQLFGGNGGDILTGSYGSDTLTGNANADKFVFNYLSDGVDTITDFKYSEGDKIQISQSGFGATSISQFSSSYNSIAKTEYLYFQGYQVATLTNLSSDSAFIPSYDISLV